MSNTNFTNCPWRSSRWSPSRKTLEMLADYILTNDKKPESILEIGGGISTWYLSQLNFKHYVTVETFEPAIENIKTHIKDVVLLKKWSDIPKRKYQYIFIDSHVGAGGQADDPSNGHKREGGLIYAHENGLIAEDSTLIVHDYNKVKKYRGDHRSRNGKRYKGWHETIDKYGWEIEHEVINKRCFGVYKLKKK